MDVLTKSEVEAIAMREIRAVDGTHLDAEQVRVPGSTLAVMVGSVVFAVIEEVQRRAFGGISSLRRRTAEDTDLDDLVYEQSFGQILRKGASAASGVVSLQRPARADAPQGSLLAGHVLLAGDVKFTLTAACHLATGQAGPLLAPVSCASAGPVGNVSANKITAFQSTPFDSTITVSNPQPTAGGTARENDSQLQVRASRFSLTVGKLAALEDAALRVRGISQAVALELPAALGGLVTTLYVGDDNGSCSDPLIEAVAAAIVAARGAGDPVRIVGATPTLVPIVLRPGYLDGFATAATQALLRKAIVAEVAQCQPDQRLRRAALITAMSSVLGVVINDDSVVEPAGDLVPISGGVFRTTESLITLL